MINPRPATCPPWCVLTHGVHSGEDDQVHVGRQMCVRNTLLRLCETVDPTTGEVEGPFVLVGTQELTLDEADALAGALVALAGQGRAATPPAAAGRRSPGPAPAAS